MTAPALSVTEQLAERLLALRVEAIPASVRTRVEELLIDVVGLCVAARRTDYISALISTLDPGGRCTAFGHEGTYRAAAAALINGTAAHGEDFDDTFEGGPVHGGAVVIPAVLAACEHYGGDGRAALLGIAAGMETVCRLSMVTPKRIHRAGFHPTSVLGTIGAAAAVGVALKLDARQLVNALGVAGSMASGIIEYLADGSWTKRMHPGWAAQSGIRAALLGRSGFLGPRSVLEGVHGLFNGFARSSEGDYDVLTDDLGKRWVMEGITFKPYATGTMNQPYIDCALRLAKRGIRAEDVVDVLCETAEGYVHRLWEPLASKHRPANEYAAKFSTPYNIAVAFITGDAGLGAFTPEKVRDERILALASRVRYVIDPDNPYPREFTGHIRVTLKDGRMVEERQPHIRGGVHEPLTRAEIEQKFLRNCEFGDWPRGRAEKFLRYAPKFFESPLDLAPLRG